MFYSQELFNQGIESLSKQITDSGIKYNYIVGINRGGLIPATVLSYKLGIPLKVITVQTYDDKVIEVNVPRHYVVTYNCLVVDDIIDSGRTLNVLLDKWQVRTMDVACLVYNQGQDEFAPTYKHLTIDKRQDCSWVTFWWDCK